MTTATIIGGNGFVGSHLARHLAARGHVTIIDPAPPPPRVQDLVTNKSATVIKSKETSISAKDVIVPDTVYFAASTWADDFSDLDLVRETLYAVCKLGVKRFVLLSTWEVQGDTSEPVTEPGSVGGPSSLLPCSIYGASRLACEAVASAVASTNDLRVWILRLAEVVGPGMVRGWPAAAMQMANTCSALLPESPSGDGIWRPYMRIEDAVFAITQLHDNTREKVNIYNVGPHDWVSHRRVLDMAIAGRQLKDVPVRMEIAAVKAGVPERVRFNNERMLRAGVRLRHHSESAVAITLHGPEKPLL